LASTEEAESVGQIVVGLAQISNITHKFCSKPGNSGCSPGTCKPVGYFVKSV